MTAPAFDLDVRPAEPVDLTPGDLDGRLIVWRVLEYGEVATRFGPRPRATVALLVCDGDDAGARHELTAFGRLARQLGEQAEGATLAGRVERWEKGTRAGYGLDYSLTDADLEQARAVITAAQGLIPVRTKRKPAARSARAAVAPVRATGEHVDPSTGEIHAPPRAAGGDLPF